MVVLKSVNGHWTCEKLLLVVHTTVHSICFLLFVCDSLLLFELDPHLLLDKVFRNVINLCGSGES